MDRYSGPTGSGDSGSSSSSERVCTSTGDVSRRPASGGSWSISSVLNPRAVYPDVVPALDELESWVSRSRSSRTGTRLAGLLESHGLAPRFSTVLISAVEKSGKPHAEIFRRAAERLGVEPGEVMHVGDSLEEDYVAARDAGLSAPFSIATAATPRNRRPDPVAVRARVPARRRAPRRRGGRPLARAR